MSTGVSTPISVFTLGIGGLVGAAASGLAAATEAVVPLATAAVEGVSAAVPAVTAAVEGISAAVPAIASGATAAAEAIGTTAPMVANVIGEAAPIAAEGAGLIAQAGGSVAEAIPQAISPVTEAAGLMQSASSALTPAEVMAQFTGPQMSTQAPASLAPNLSSQAANMSTAAGPVYSAPTSMPSTTETAAASWRDNPWVQKGGKALKSLGKSASSMDSQGQQQQPQGGAAMGGPQYAAPPPDPYVSSNREDQLQKSQNIMDDYLSSGGAFYG